MPLGHRVRQVISALALALVGSSAQKIQQRLELHALKHNGFPTTAQGLQAVFDPEPPPADAWGMPSTCGYASSDAAVSGYAAAFVPHDHV